ncbi:hypothetical protein B0H63DRAFT_528052 [Podospora didyma]|uniref:Uncharacterized protein n=1 Tax=Podospora didyma TaxID=330526 RepID=A0AAE0K578_9PEZI|nr:hypothetical protein B0H63DRAFT_528052 [Podospora didyma]
MSATRALALRSTLGTACRRPVRCQLTQPLTRRGYASSQGHGAKSSELPWLITSVGLTLPAAIYIWNQGSSKNSHGGGHGGGHEKHEEATDDSAKASTEDTEESQDSPSDGGEDESPKSNDSKEESKSEESDGKGKPIISGSDSQGLSTEMDDSQESQAQKLTDKPASKRVDPTQK